MEIQWFGQSFIRLNVKSPQNGDYSLHIDPYQVKTLGLRQPKMEASIVMLSGGKLDSKLKYGNEYLLVQGPGEYESQQIFVYGLGEVDKEGVPSGMTMYVIEAEGMTIAHLGTIKQTEFTDKQLEYLENVDILILPIGGSNTLNSKQAAAVIHQIEPRVIIPICYSFPGSKLKIDKIDTLLKELNGVKSEVVEKIKLSKKDLPTDDSRLYILNP